MTKISPSQHRIVPPVCTVITGVAMQDARDTFWYVLRPKENPLLKWEKHCTELQWSSETQIPFRYSNSQMFPKWSVMSMCVVDLWMICFDLVVEMNSWSSHEATGCNPGNLFHFSDRANATINSRSTWAWTVVRKQAGSSLQTMRLLRRELNFRFRCLL